MFFDLNLLWFTFLTDFIRFCILLLLLCCGLFWYRISTVLATTAITFASFVIRSGRYSIPCFFLISMTSFTIFTIFSNLILFHDHFRVLTAIQHNFHPYSTTISWLQPKNSSLFFITAWSFKPRLPKKCSQTYFSFPCKIYHKFRHIFW